MRTPRYRSEEQDEAIKLAASGKQWGEAKCMDKKCGEEWFAIYYSNGAPYLQCPKCRMHTGQVKSPQRPL